MVFDLLSPARARRIGQALRVELRLWLHTMIAGASVTFVLWTVVRLALAYVRAPFVDMLDGAALLALPWAAAGAGGLLAMFLARALAVGLSDGFFQAEARARAVTTLGVAAGVAMVAAALVFAWPARAEAPSAGASDYCARDLGAWFYCTRPAPPEEEKAAREAGSLQLDRPAEIVELEAFQKEVDEARQIAVWAPTEANVRRFHSLQKVALDRGGLFADQWRRLVWTRLHAIGEIAERLRAGSDVAPWLSDSVRTRRADPHADLMFNDWQVSHFHLGRVYASKDKIARTNELLFAYVTHKEAILLDVRPHGAWSETGILRALLDVAPEVMERYRLKGVMGMTASCTERELGQLRRAGVTTPIEINGNVYLSPGQGVSTSRHAVRFTLLAQKWRRAIRDLAAELEASTHNSFALALSQTIGVPVVLGALSDGPWLHVYDKRRGLSFGRFGPIC